MLDLYFHQITLESDSCLSDSPDRQSPTNSFMEPQILSLSLNTVVIHGDCIKNDSGSILDATLPVTTQNGLKGVVDHPRGLDSWRRARYRTILTVDRRIPIHQPWCAHAKATNTHSAPLIPYRLRVVIRNTLPKSTGPWADQAQDTYRRVFLGYYKLLFGPRFLENSGMYPLDVAGEAWNFSVPEQPF